MSTPISPHWKLRLRSLRYEVRTRGTILKPKFPISDYRFITILTDTEGNTIGLHSLS